jgi:hypothetical protein
MLDALRGEFASSDFDAPTDAAAQYREGWERIKTAVKPSYMVDMR